jgi:hypothetical protein
MGKPQLALVCPWAPSTDSAVTDYLAWVVRGLSRWSRVHVVLTGCTADPGLFPDCERVWPVGMQLRPILSVLEQIDPFRIVLQYSPFLWNRRGFDLLGPELARRLARAGRPVDTFFHELWVPLGPSAGLLLRTLFQRLVVAILAGHSRRVIVTSRERIDEVRSCLFRDRERVRMVPLSTLIPVEGPVDRAAVRSGLGVTENELLLCALGFHHDSKPTAGLWAVWKTLQMAGVRSRLLLIGSAHLPLPAGATAEMGRWILAPGYCAAPRASALLSASDVFLAPLTDGVSSRRTSVAAAMAHRLPVVTTRGHHTDAELYTPEIMALVPAFDHQAFAAEVLDLARSPERRAQLARDAHQLFEDRLDWPHHWQALREAHDL